MFTGVGARLERVNSLVSISILSVLDNKELTLNTTTLNVSQSVGVGDSHIGLRVSNVPKSNLANTGMSHMPARVILLSTSSINLLEHLLKTKVLLGAQAGKTDNATVLELLAQLHSTVRSRGSGSGGNDDGGAMSRAGGGGDNNSGNGNRGRGRSGGNDDGGDRSGAGGRSDNNGGLLGRGGIGLLGRGGIGLLGGRVVHNNDGGFFLGGRSLLLLLVSRGSNSSSSDSSDSSSTNKGSSGSVVVVVVVTSASTGDGNIDMDSSSSSARHIRSFFLSLGNVKNEEPNASRNAYFRELFFIFFYRVVVFAVLRTR